MNNFFRSSKKQFLPLYFSASLVCYVFTALVLSGCVQNVLHEATYYRYMEQGSQAYNAGNYIAAEMAYQRALTNVQWGDLGPEKKAVALHEIGNAKRLLGKYEEAEEYLLSSLALHEEIYTDDTNRFYIGNVLGDLAWCYFDQNKLEEGVKMLSRMESLYLKYSDLYFKNTRIAMKHLFSIYATELDKYGKATEAKHFQSIADQIITPKE